MENRPFTLKYDFAVGGSILDFGIFRSFDNLKVLSPVINFNAIQGLVPVPIGRMAFTFSNVNGLTVLSID